MAHLPPNEVEWVALRSGANEDPREFLGVGSGNGAWGLGDADRLLSVSSKSASVLSPYPGFHPLPPRTGREVFPHPALR